MIINCENYPKKTLKIQINNDKSFHDFMVNQDGRVRNRADMARLIMGNQYNKTCSKCAFLTKKTKFCEVVKAEIQNSKPHGCPLRYNYRWMYSDRSMLKRRRKVKESDKAGEFYAHQWELWKSYYQYPYYGAGSVLIG